MLVASRMECVCRMCQKSVESLDRRGHRLERLNRRHRNVGVPRGK